MELKDKELLLKDLCARLPYGVKVKVLIEEVKYDAVVHGVYADGTVFVEQISEPNKIHHIDVVHISEVKPYLFSLSDMTEEQKHKFLCTCNGYCDYYWTEETFDWLNTNHFDYRGFIEKDLVINATGLNIY